VGVDSPSIRVCDGGGEADRQRRGGGDGGGHQPQAGGAGRRPPEHRGHRGPGLRAQVPRHHLRWRRHGARALRLAALRPCALRRRPPRLGRAAPRLHRQQRRSHPEQKVSLSPLFSPLPPLPPDWIDVCSIWLRSCGFGLWFRPTRHTKLGLICLIMCLFVRSSSCVRVAFRSIGRWLRIYQRMYSCIPLMFGSVDLFAPSFQSVPVNGVAD
jgi:hypothetical protein